MANSIRPQEMFEQQFLPTRRRRRREPRHQSPGSPSEFILKL